MAWTYMTGVVMPAGSHFIDGPSTADRTNLDHLRPKAIRRIYQQANRPWNNASNTGWVRQQTDLFQSKGKFHIPCIGDHTDSSMTTAQWQTSCRELKSAIYPGSTVVEVLNEPFVQYWDGRAGTGDMYWQRIREASAIFRPELEVIMSLPPKGTAKDLAFLNRAQAVNIWPYIDGFVLHPYSTTPGSATSPLSASNPDGTTVLGWTWQRRKQVDAFGAGPASKHLWVTEFGWCTRGTTGPQSLLCTEAVQASRITTAYTQWERHCEELKLRAACYFSWNDWNTAGSTDAFDYSGIRTNEVSPNTPPWHYKGGGGQVGEIGSSPGGAKAAFDSFEPEVIIGAAVGTAPDAVTMSADQIAAASARARGTVDPNNLPTTWFHEYSTAPLPGLVYAIPNTGAVLKEDKPSTADVLSVWNNYNPGPLTRWQYFTSGGDPHPLVDGSVHPNYRKVTLVDGDGDPNPGSPGDEERQQVGGAGPVVRFFQGYEGTHIIMYWSCRVPSLTITGGDSSMLWEFQNQTRSGSPPISFDQVAPGNKLNLGWKYTPGSSRAVVWEATVPTDTWLRFAVEILFSTNISLGRMRLWGNLAESGDLSLASLTPLLTQHATLYPESPENSSGLVWGIYQDDQIAGHAKDYAGIQICEYV